MDFVKMVEVLRTERAQIEEAIMALERLAWAGETPWSAARLDDANEETWPPAWQQEQA